MHQLPTSRGRRGWGRSPCAEASLLREEGWRPYRLLAAFTEHLLWTEQARVHPEEQERGQNRTPLAPHRRKRAGWQLATCPPHPGLHHPLRCTPRPCWCQIQRGVLPRVSLKPEQLPSPAALSALTPATAFLPPANTSRLRLQDAGTTKGGRAAGTCPQGRGWPALSQGSLTTCLGPSAQSPPPRAPSHPLALWGAFPVLDSHPISLKPTGPRPVWSSPWPGGEVRGQMQNKPPVGRIDRGESRVVLLFLKCPGAEGSSTQAKVAKSFSQMATFMESNSHSRPSEPPRGGCQAHPGSSQPPGWAGPGTAWSPHPLLMALR